MEGSNEFYNQTLQIEKYIICINEETEVNQIREKSENPSLQTKVNRVSRKSNEEKNGVFIIEMHFVGPFIVLMIT
jgi:hypothetical protein